MIAAAMKLNMIVVMTTWLPRLACSQPGMKAQKPPQMPAAMMASGITSSQWVWSSQSATAAAPRPAI